MSDPRAKFLSFLDSAISAGGDNSAEATELKEVFKPWAEKMATTASGAVAEANTLREANGGFTEQLKKLQEQAEANGGKVSEFDTLSKQVTALTDKLDATEKAKAQVEADNRKEKQINAYTNGLNINPKVRANLVKNLVNDGSIIEQDGKMGALVDGIFTSAEEHFKVIESEYSEFITPAKGASAPAANTPSDSSDKYAGMNYTQILAKMQTEES